LYSDAIVDDETETVTAFVPIDEPFLLDSEYRAAGIGFDELPARGSVALVHLDGFATIGETYRILGAWVGRNRRALVGTPIWESYPNLDPPTNPADSFIELRWPIDV
jgi:hypothetical protein